MPNCCFDICSDIGCINGPCGSRDRDQNARSRFVCCCVILCIYSLKFHENSLILGKYNNPKDYIQIYVYIHIFSPTLSLSLSLSLYIYMYLIRYCNPRHEQPQQVKIVQAAASAAGTTMSWIRQISRVSRRSRGGA